LREATRAYGRGRTAFIEPASANLLPYSAFSADANSDGLADGWVVSKTATGTVTTSRAAPLVYAGVSGAKAQRLQYTAPTETGKNFNLYKNATAGTFAESDPATLSAWLYGSNPGTAVRLWVYVYNASNGLLEAEQSDQIVLAATPVRYHVTKASCPALTSYCRAVLQVSSIDTGDVVDFNAECAQLEKLAYPTNYIPTTTAAASRLADDLTGAVWGWTPGDGTGLVCRRALNGSAWAVDEMPSGAVVDYLTGYEVSGIVTFDRTLATAEIAAIRNEVLAGPRRLTKVV